jgi:hypothetical protein
MHDVLLLQRMCPSAHRAAPGGGHVSRECHQPRRWQGAQPGRTSRLSNAASIVGGGVLGRRTFTMGCSGSERLANEPVSHRPHVSEASPRSTGIRGGLAESSRFCEHARAAPSLLEYARQRRMTARPASRAGPAHGALEPRTPSGIPVDAQACDSVRGAGGGCGGGGGGSIWGSRGVLGASGGD